MKNKDTTLISAIADLISQRANQTTTRSTPAPKRSNKRSHAQTEKYFSSVSDDDNEDSVSDIEKKKKNVTSTPIKHGTKAAKHLTLLTNNFDLTYQDVKIYLLSTAEAYHPHTVD